jgi:hypothetical protein
MNVPICDSRLSHMNMQTKGQRQVKKSVYTLYTVTQVLGLSSHLQSSHLKPQALFHEYHIL